MSSVASRLAENDRRLDQHDQDIRDIHREIKGLRRDVRQEFQAVRQEMGQEFRAVRQEMGQEFRAVRQEMDQKFQTVHREIGWLHRAMSGVMARLGVEPPGDEEE